MKTSIAITLIITATIFSFVSGYSIGSHSDQAASYQVASQSNSGSVATAIAAENVEKSSSPAGGYGTPSGVDSSSNTGASPGYGAPAPGYGAPAAPGYGK
jgi:FlaG/FlaF family flagellin (archaellin)